jgi:hypothetical protein
MIIRENIYLFKQWGGANTSANNHAGTLARAMFVNTTAIESD